MRKSYSVDRFTSCALVLYSSCTLLTTGVQARSVLCLTLSLGVQVVVLLTFAARQDHTEWLQGLHETARSSVLLPLGPTTATQSEASLPTQSPINLTFEYPVAGQCHSARSIASD